MRTLLRLGAALVVCSLGLGSQGVAPPDQRIDGQWSLTDARDAANARYAAGEVVVRWRGGVSEPALRSIHGRVIEQELDSGVTLVGVREGSELQAAAHLGSLPHVVWAQPNYLRRIQLASNDPLFGQQWGLQRIQTPAAWDISLGSSSVIVAIVDTGVDLKHPDLQGKLVQGRNLLRPDSPPLDDGGHGTHVAGTIGATINNSIGIVGVASGVSIMPVKALRGNGSGKDTNVAAGIRWATDNGARVINMSFTGTDPSPILSEAVVYATNRNVSLVVAGGNEATAAPSYPAATKPAIAVAATDIMDRRAYFSSYGDWVDIAAPGAGILSTYWDGDSTYKSDSGTSMAAPHVSGVIALMLSVRPTLTPLEVQAILKSTADPVGDPGMGAGRINAARAVAVAAQYQGSTSTAPVAPALGTAASAPPTPTTRLVAPAGAQPIALTYNAPASGQTVYFPAIWPDMEGLGSKLTVQNVADAAGTVTIQFFDEEGSVSGATSFGLSGRGGATVSADALGFGSKYRYVSAVVASDVPIAAVVTMSQTGGDSMGYEGRVEGASTLYAPLVFKNRNGWNSRVFVQNLGDKPTAVEVVYGGRPDAGGLGSETATIPPLASRSFALAANPALPEDFAGSLVARSTDGVPLALVVTQTSSSGAASAYAGFSAGATDLAAAIVFKNRQTNGVWNTGIQLQNLGSEPARTRVSYTRSDGSRLPANETATIAPGSSHTFYQAQNPSLPNDFVGAAEISVDNGQPVIGLVNEVNYAKNISTTYDLLGAGEPELHMPVVLRGVDGHNTSLQVQNRGQAATSIAIAYLTPDGRVAASQNDTIGAGAAKTYYLPSISELPAGFVGCATVSSLDGQPLAALVNVVRY